MVPFHPAGRAAEQGPAVLSSAGRERRHRIHRLCLGAEPYRRFFRRAVAASSSPRVIRRPARRHFPLPLPARALSSATARALPLEPPFPSTSDKAAQTNLRGL